MSYIKFSFANVVDGATITGSSEDADYPASNIANPERPFLPWRTTAITDQNVVIDFTTTTQLSLIILVRTNFAAATIQGNATNTWGAPSYSQAVTIARNPVMWRYQYAILPVGFNYRYLRIFIPAQTPVDGASYFLLGGVWAGATLTPPKNFLLQVEYEALEPKRDLQPDHSGWRQRLVLGEPVCVMRTRRMAEVSFIRRRATPFVDDQLQDWMDLDRQMRDADYFGLFLNNDDPSQGYVMRRVSDAQWAHSRRTRAESQFDLEEVIR